MGDQTGHRRRPMGTLKHHLNHTESHVPCNREVSENVLTEGLDKQRTSVLRGGTRTRGATTGKPA